MKKKGIKKEKTLWEAMSVKITKEEVGLRLHALRKQTGKTQAQFAEALGYKTSTYQTWEQGRHWVDPEAAPIIAEFHGVTLQYLYTGEDPPSADLSDEEMSLIRVFRKASDLGKRDIMKAAMDTLMGD